MTRIVDTEIKNALRNKGYRWENITIKSFLGYIHFFEIKLDGKFVEVYDARKKMFID